MEGRNVRFTILRSRPGDAEPPRFQSFDLFLGPGATVMDGLEAIHAGPDPGLLYRHSCHHASCGTCACRINGTERLACVTTVRELGTEEVVLEPLEGFPCAGDLVVDMTRLFLAMPADWSCLRSSESRPGVPIAQGVGRYERFEDCIECGACISACPVSGRDDAFLGPAGLAAANREARKNPDRASTLLEPVGSKRGAPRCERALECSRVCPTGVYPARHIQELLNLLGPPG
jgi:succinate dehydrogenase / fumarate reductase iron-sulfur subunit